MRHAETMEDVLRYIDEHISQGLTAEELARVSGYSFYHFCHLFAIDMGLSVGTYLRRRRLELAAGEILQGGSITEISTKSGFETPVRFFKSVPQALWNGPHGIQEQERRNRCDDTGNQVCGGLFGSGVLPGSSGGRI